MSFILALLDFREPVNAWSHCLGLWLSLPATLFLWKRCGGDPARRLALLVFGLSLAICYAGSTLFHAVRLPRVWIDRFDQLDHIGIFILIAGSYTPVAWTFLDGRLKWATLGSVWSLSALGTALLLHYGVFSMFWSTLFYLVLGWGALICYIEMARVLSHRSLFLLLLGGVFYTVGAVINLVHWPVIRPGLFGEHELFHVFVIAGSLAHFLFMYHVVAPAVGRARAAGIGRPISQVGATGDPGSGNTPPGLVAFPDPSRPIGYCQPLYLHASPDWSRDEGV